MKMVEFLQLKAMHHNIIVYTGATTRYSNQKPGM